MVICRRAVHEIEVNRAGSLFIWTHFSFLKILLTVATFWLSWSTGSACLHMNTHLGAVHMNENFNGKRGNIQTIFKARFYKTESFLLWNIFPLTEEIFIDMIFLYSNILFLFISVDIYVKLVSYRYKNNLIIAIVFPWRHGITYINEGDFTITNNHDFWG